VTDAQVPAAIFLARRVPVNTAFGPFVAEPGGEIVSRTAEIDRRTDFGEIEAPEPEEKIDGIHRLSFPE